MVFGLFGSYVTDSFVQMKALGTLQNFLHHRNIILNLLQRIRFIF